MRILQLNLERGWRGGERQVLLTLRELRRAGHETALLARRGAELAQRALAEGHTVHECSGAAGLCAALLRHGRAYDILHAQTANTLSWLALLKGWLRRPVVFTRRTAFTKSGGMARTIWKWRRADALVAISQAAAAQPRSLGLSVSIIPSAVEASPANPVHCSEFAARLGLRGRRVLATAAALTREKDPCTLVRAVHELGKNRDDFVFVHLGAEGGAAEPARQLVAELGLQERYLFAGFEPAVEDLYALMDVFVLSSRAEALGTSVLDAFLRRVPVAATNAGGLKESLADGRGLDCEVGDHMALARAMARLLDDEALRQSVIEKAYAYVVREHGPAHMAERYIELYQGLAAPQSRP